MKEGHIRNTNFRDPADVDVHFSPGVVQAFRDLEAAIHFSDHFDADSRNLLQQMASGKPLSVRDVIVSLPLLAEETFGHINATGDKRAADAWTNIGSELVEKGFALGKVSGGNSADLHLTSFSFIHLRCSVTIAAEAID